MALESLTEHLRQAQSAAENASQAKSVFLANMSHELRTPFNGLLGMLSLLEGTRLDDQQSGHLRMARGSADHLLALLNDILDFSQLESGQLQLTLEPVPLAAVLEEVHALIAPTAQDKGLDTRLVWQTGAPQQVMADPRRLKQILFNLCSNAVKFTDHGAVVLEVAAGAMPPASPHNDSTRGAGVAITVRDTGPGIAAEVLPRLFQRFSQGDSGSARRHGGTGLGLEISRNLARAMGGELGVRSQAGQGAAFTLTLAAPAPTRVLDVLVVDDHPVNREYLAMLLRRLGHDVRLAESGAQALAEVDRRVPQLVLMDLHMPGQDGFQAARRLRQQVTSAERMPIVAVSADVFDVTRERARQAGMARFLAKPVRPSDIDALLAELAGDSHPEQAGLASATRPAAGLPTAPDATVGPPDAVAVVPATVPVPAPASSAAAGPAAHSSAPRRFKAADVGTLLDMALIGEVCVSVGLSNWQKVAAGLLDDQAGSLGALSAALDQGPGAELAALAHAVKGASASLGLKALSAKALEIERRGASFQPAEAVQAAQDLRACRAETRALLQRMGMMSGG
jgi:CheY-like chemotaxis protein